MTKQYVRVLMYRIGFGDAFLLRFPDSQGTERKILIDCGRHFQTPTKKVGKTKPPPAQSAIVDRILADVANEQGVPEIDLVIATHRHQDHVSGFESKKWANVLVKEVWMPWTEDPTDPQARKIRQTQSRLAMRLDEDARRLGLNDAGIRGMVANSLSNESAMATLHRGFAGKPKRRFLEGKMQTLKPGFLPGLSVHVLGPSRDDDVIRDMDPPAGQSYLRARKSSSSGSSTPAPLFHIRFETTEPELAASHPQLVATREQKAHLKELAEGDPFMVAAALEKAVNGTSLMLTFELGKAVLLFPGDAQWGTWNRALQSPKAREVMARTTFYKIGHHGSHNATPKAFVEELLGDNLSAMASVWPIARFPAIPKRELMQRLQQKHTHVARADEPPSEFAHDDEVVETKVLIG